METLPQLEAKLATLEEQIREAERRLPAHSTKPATMMMLLELEDERDDLVARIFALKSSLPQQPH